MDVLDNGLRSERLREKVGLFPAEGRNRGQFPVPEDVRREVFSRLETLGQGGGLILGPTHHVQLDTPMENFWAMVDTITGTPYPVEAND